MERYKSKLEKLEQKLQIDEISEVNNSTRESVHEASTNTKEFMHNFIWLLISNLRAVIKIRSLDELLWVFLLSASKLNKIMCKQSRMSKKMFLMLCNAPGVPIGRGITHDTPNMNFCQNWAFHLPPVFMSQNAKTITFGLRPDNQYFPLTASPSLAFISLHDMAASRGVEPRGTGKKRLAMCSNGHWQNSLRKNHFFWSEPCLYARHSTAWPK